jgi:hypothetical protein
VVTCPICERRFDERAYQVVVKGLGSFDSVACLEAALRRRARHARKLTYDVPWPASSPRDTERAEPIRKDHEN